MLNNSWSDFFDIEEVFTTAADDSAACIISSYKAADDALISCINTFGRVDLNWMSQTSGLSVTELTDALSKTIFQNPAVYDRTRDETSGWMLRSQYLMGNVKEKLDLAVHMNRKYPGRFPSNIAALKPLLPKKLSLEEIGYSIGSAWIPAKIYANFARDALGLFTKPVIEFSRSLHQWHVQTPKTNRKSVNNLVTYGTPRMDALTIIEHALNSKPIKIYDEVPRPNTKSGTARVLNRDASLAAAGKLEQLQAVFHNWIRSNPTRVKELEKIYYDTYGCNVAGSFEGSFLRLPELNPSVSLYQHQKDAIARIVLDQDVLLNHSVGSGKTYVIVCGIHERKRMHLSEKNLIVVPNNVLEAFERAHRLLYPEDPILVVRTEDFTPAKREAALRAMRDNDYTAIYLSFSSFDLIPMSRYYKLSKKQEEIWHLRSLAATSAHSWEKNKLEYQAEQECKRMQKMQEELPPDLYPCFDELDVTTLVVDEVHNYKNISLHTRAEGVVGMHAKGSKKCDEMLEKAAFTRNGGGSLIFSTGTPLTNSLSDLFVLQKYLQPEQLDLLHLGSFDEWIGSFGVRKSNFEVDVDSRSFVIKTRFSHFHNLPELTSLFANVCDFYNGKNSGMGLPVCNGYIDTVVEKQPEQKEYIDLLVLRTEMIRQKLVRPEEDNLLKITHDGRAAALDIRLTEPGATPNPALTKTYACAKNIYEVWKSYPGTAQLVFCDLSTPKAGFNVYDTLKMHLIEMGVPSGEIAFIHDAPTDARRRKLFSGVNAGKIRVLLGSTSKLGTGVNVQEKLIAIHHLDCPWRPSDLIQREGRLIRQGNSNKEVYRYRYITSGTFDAYSWQIIENKQRFISQFMCNSLLDRDARDIDDAVLSYAEIKALSVGDPLLKTRIETSNALERVKIQQQERQTELQNLTAMINNSPTVKKNLNTKRSQLCTDIDYFRITQEKQSREERFAFGEDLLSALALNDSMLSVRHYGNIHGFRILLPADMKPAKPYVILSGPSGLRYEISMKDAKPIGCMQRIEYVLTHLEDRVREVKGQLSDHNRQIKYAKAELAKGNHFAEKIKELTEKLLTIDVELSRRAAQSAC